MFRLPQNKKALRRMFYVKDTQSKLKKGTTDTKEQGIGNSVISEQETKVVSTNKTRLSKGDYLKKFQTLMYVNSKYFNLQKFFENKKQLNMQNSEENFEEEIKILNKKRKKRKISRLMREKKKVNIRSMDKYKLFKKRKRLDSSYTKIKNRFSIMDRKVLANNRSVSKNSKAQLLIQSCLPMNSHMKRFSMAPQVFPKNRLEFKLPIKRNVRNGDPQSSGSNESKSSKSSRSKTTLNRSTSKGKSLFMASNKIKASINMIRKKCNTPS
jgi:hypothetical protein